MFLGSTHVELATIFSAFCVASRTLMSAASFSFFIFSSVICFFTTLRRLSIVSQRDGTIPSLPSGSADGCTTR